jgi:uncharacterized protein (DUF433 family)
MQLPDFLTEDPHGEITLVGHRIGLFTVVRRFKEGLSAEQLAEEYPSLPLDHIQKVIAFYCANTAEVDTYVEAYRAELERQATEPAKGPDLAELKRRWQARGLGKLP